MTHVMAVVSDVDRRTRLFEWAGKDAPGRFHESMLTRSASLAWFQYVHL